MPSPTVSLIAHTVILVTVAICYTILTATEHDGNALLIAGGSWAGAAGVSALAGKLGRAA